MKVNLIKYFISNVLNKRVFCPNFGEGVLVEGVLSEGVLGVYDSKGGLTNVRPRHFARISNDAH